MRMSKPGLTAIRGFFLTMGHSAKNSPTQSQEYLDDLAGLDALQVLRGTRSNPFVCTPDDLPGVLSVSLTKQSSPDVTTLQATSCAGSLITPESSVCRNLSA